MVNNMILTQKDNVTLKDAKCDKLYGRAICLGIIVFLITIFSYKFILQDDYEKYKSIEGCTNVFGWNAEILWLSIGLGLMLGVLYLLIVFSIKIKKDTNKMYFINKAKEVKKRLWIYIVCLL